MFRITTATRVAMPQPDASWSLSPGANHFEEVMPEAVADRLGDLVRAGALTVEVINPDGEVSDWEPPAAPADPDAPKG